MLILIIGTHILLLLLSRFNHVRLCATPQTAAHQSPLSLGFSRQEHWSGLPSPSPMQLLAISKKSHSKDKKWPQLRKPKIISGEVPKMSSKNRLDSNCPSRYTGQRIESRDSNMYLYTHVLIQQHYSQQLEGRNNPKVH